MHLRPFHGRSLPARKWVLLGLLAFALLAGAVSAQSLGAQSLTLPVENSWIRIQNVGTSAATIQLDFYDRSGNLVGSDGCPEVDGCAALRPGFGWSFFQQSLDELKPGYQGSAFVTVDQPFVAMLARDAFLSNGSFQIGGDALRLGSSGGSQYLPIVQNTASHVSRITIENSSDTNAACVGVRYYKPGSTSSVALDPATPGAGCASGGVLVAPRATLVRDERSMAVPLGFDGSAVVETFRTDSGIEAGSQTLAVTVDTRSRTSAGLATSRSIGTDELSHVVLLPLVDRNASQGQTTWSTRFRILSGTPSVPNEVTLLFDGKNAAGERIEIEHTVTVAGSLTCDQRSDGAIGCLPPGQPLPSTFFGTVRMEAVDPIAVVAQRISPNGAFADYRGFTAEEASRQVVLPVLNKNYGPWGASRGWNSWFRVLSFDGSVAHVTVIYYSKQFPDGLFPPGAARVDGQRTFVQWENGALPDGWVGSAVVVADRPVVVVANLESDVFGGDPVMLYNGVSLE
ncbi:MAG: hypothetical protein O3A10_05560 [Chloroflexi bacterium]|nr:hypothetical protein [Chloroflexota bacterium]MDA1146146.1 hypothetical protein [Chloroflexota bacterium]